MKTKKNLLEWSVFGASVAVILATVALLVAGGSGARRRMPDLRVDVGTPVPTATGFSVPIVVSNAGDVTAEQVRVEILLQAEGETVERAELAMAFVPRRSKREGWVVFRRDPRCCVVAAGAMAYDKP
ncbi:MAG TPA: hypothetical protein VHL59_15680 [Thermoanaerobaculia bacterium]|nr:hypothetical protein [Thermoanaerobaculia bacterium]